MGYLWGQHLANQRAVTLWQRLEIDLPTQGGRLELVAYSGATESYTQFVWITRVTESTRTFYDSQGAFQVREVVLEIAEGLSNPFVGLEPSRTDPTSFTSRVYSTRYNANSFPVYGIRPLIEQADVGDYTVKVDTLYAPLIPTAFSETALPTITA